MPDQVPEDVCGGCGREAPEAISWSPVFGLYLCVHCRFNKTNALLDNFTWTPAA